MRLKNSGHFQLPARQYSRAADVMKSVVEKTVNEQVTAFEDVVGILRHLDGYRTFKEIGDELFNYESWNSADGERCNWGRIVVWYSFWAHVFSVLSAEQGLEAVNVFGNFVGWYLAQRQGDAILAAGGWETFVRIYGSSGRVNKTLRYVTNVISYIVQYYPHRL